MDISIEKKPPAIYRKHWYVFLVIGVVAAALWLKRSFGEVSYVADRDTLRIMDVKRDKFYVDVRSNGELRPKRYHWISAEVNGHVEEVFVDAGDSVDIGDPLIRLRNPELLKTLENSEWEYKQAKAEVFANQKSLESELLEMQAEALRVELAYQSNLLKMKAEKKLIDSGIAIVPELDFRRTVFSVEEQKEIGAFYKKRLKKLQENIEAQKWADDARIARLENEYKNARRQVESLTVRSIAKGLIQEFQLEIGQKLDVGSTVTTIADDRELIAELKVQELQVQAIEIGHPVIIDTRKNKLKGSVIRIHPSATNGMVRIDAGFDEPLPPEARIALSVEGLIRTHALDNALFVQRPAFVQSNATAGLFRVSDDGSLAYRVPVRLGQSSVNFVQILDGLEEGDRIIVSDTSAYAEHEKILIN